MQTQTEAAALTNREKGEKTSKLRKKIPAGKISVAIFIVVMLIYPLFRSYQPSHLRSHSTA